MVASGAGLNGEAATYPVLDALVFLTFWMLWKEHDERIFHGRTSLPEDVEHRIFEEAQLWSLVGFRKLDLGRLVSGPWSLTVHVN